MSYDFCEFRTRAMQFMTVASLLSENKLIDEYKLVADIYRNFYDPSWSLSAKNIKRDCDKVYVAALEEHVNKGI